MDRAKIMLLRTARRKGGAASSRRTLVPTISREEHSSSAPFGIRLLRSRAGAGELSKDMEQNSEGRYVSNSATVKTVLLRAAHFVAKTLSSQASAHVFAAVLRNIG